MTDLLEEESFDVVGLNDVLQESAELAPAIDDLPVEPLSDASGLVGIGDDTSQDIVSMYLNQIGMIPLLSAEDELRLARRVSTGDAKARQDMILHNLRLVVSVAKRYLHRGLPLLDLVEEGNLGLIHAVEKYDPARGCRFSTYASWWIKAAIGNALLTSTRVIRLPAHMHRNIGIVLRVKTQLEALHGGAHKTTYEEIACHAGLTSQQVRETLDACMDTASLDTSAGDDDAASLVATLPIEGYAPDEHIEQQQLAAILQDYLEKLSSTERIILCRRFGLGNDSPETFDAIGEDLGLSKERIRQIQMGALVKLKKFLCRDSITV